MDDLSDEILLSSTECNVSIWAVNEVHDVYINNHNSTYCGVVSAVRMTHHLQVMESMIPPNTHDEVEVRVMGVHSI